MSAWPLARHVVKAPAARRRAAALSSFSDVTKCQAGDSRMNEGARRPARWLSEPATAATACSSYRPTQRLTSQPAGLALRRCSRAACHRWVPGCGSGVRRHTCTVHRLRWGVGDLVTVKAAGAWTGAANRGGIISAEPEPSGQPGQARQAPVLAAHCILAIELGLVRRWSARSLHMPPCSQLVPTVANRHAHRSDLVPRG